MNGLFIFSLQSFKAPNFFILMMFKVFFLLLLMLLVLYLRNHCPIQGHKNLYFCFPLRGTVSPHSLGSTFPRSLQRTSFPAPSHYGYNLALPSFLIFTYLMGITDSVDMSLSKLRKIVKDREA